MRLFFAAFPDSETLGRLAHAVRALRAPAAWTLLPADRYHMTLLFLGEVCESDIPVVRGLGEAQRAASVALRFDRWEYWEPPRVVVAAASELPQALAQLRSGLAGALAGRAFAFDDKPLRPHITVARKIAQAPVLPALTEFVWRMRTFSLVVSAQEPRGYTVIASWPLLDMRADR